MNGDVAPVREGCLLGIDVGSVSVDIVVLDSDGRIRHGRYRRHHGRPDRVLAENLEDIERDHVISGAAVTGAGAGRLQRLLGASVVNEVIAQVEAARAAYPHVRSIIDIGGQDSKYIQLEGDPASGGLRLKDFSVSSLCASGTGGFLDQQAVRLGLSIEREFGESALRSAHPARVAGRCSVFAKSDMIHLQQKGTPLDDIVAGLCQALVRGFKTAVLGVKPLQVPLALVGGVAANAGVVRALTDVLGIARDEIFIPERFALTGALGAAMLLKNGGVRPEAYRGVQAFREARRAETDHTPRLPPLPRPPPAVSTPVSPLPVSGEPVPVYLGVDIGSISTNIVLMDEQGAVVAKYYLMTASRPIEAVREGFRDILLRFGDSVTVRGVGTTGSGRHLIGDLIGADVVVNEITAHARAAVFADPDVDTVFEIGGQDSKYIHLTQGLVDDFTMNKACAAGTGSFLEEQAEKLGISIERDFARLALSAAAPVDCGEQCTVFIESEVVRHQQAGIDLPDILAGLAHGIATNYLHKVVENRTVGERILFQGGVAFNTAVRAALERLTGKSPKVPPHHEVMGALGSCLLAMGGARTSPHEETRFQGFEALERGFVQESFQCDHCPNQCDINKIMVPGRPDLYYGGRCERYEVKRRTVRREMPRDLVREREKLLFAGHDSGAEPGQGTIGYPRILTFHEYFPFFQTFFSELGFRVLPSPPTNAAIIREGLAHVASATCFPTKVAHGHAAWMKEAARRGEVDAVFIPSVRETLPADGAHPYANHCSYVQFIPDLVNDALGLEADGIHLLRPALHFRLGEAHILREMRRTVRQLGVTSRRAVANALRLAWRRYRDFREARLALGREALAAIGDGERAVVLAGKAHNIHDPGTNMNLSRLLREMGVGVIPMDLLDCFHSPEVGEAWRNMTLAMGQRTLAVADITRRDPRLHAVYLANFGCVNDSIYPKFFRREMGDKPFLFLEVDEHSAEAGVITRCEAFLDSLRNVDRRKRYLPKRTRKREYDPDDGRTLYLPHAANGMAVWAAALRAFGIRAETLPPPDDRSLYWGRRCLDGKECLPCTLMTGDMLRLIGDRGVPPEKTAFFMPGSCGSCRYDLFNTLQRVVFEEQGLDEAVLVDEYQGANRKLHRLMARRDYGLLAWRGFMAADILEKLRLHIRPHEREAGSVDALYHERLAHLAEVVERRGDVERVVAESVARLSSLNGRSHAPRPVIGLVGEAYLRNVDYASNHLIQRLEALGAEVRMPAIMEVLWYTLYKQRYYRERRGERISGWLLRFQHRLLTGIEQRLRRHADGVLPHSRETRVWDVIEASGFSLDAGLGFGAAVEMAKRGVHGIVHAIPFNCVPGLMIQGLENRFRKLFPHIPFLTVAFHGHDDPGVATRLEALVHRCGETLRS